VGALVLVSAKKPFMKGHAMARMLCAQAGGL
jgi:hypothetical protein